MKITEALLIIFMMLIVVPFFIVGLLFQPVRMLLCMKYKGCIKCPLLGICSDEIEES